MSHSPKPPRHDTMREWYFRDMLDGERPNAHDKPQRFEEEIQALESAERATPTPPGSIAFYGSSSIRFWHEWLARDMAPLSVAPRGFGGSNLHDACHYLERLLLPLRPRAVVFYEGDNDLAIGIPPETVMRGYRLFLERFRRLLPQARLYLLAIKPSPCRNHFQESIDAVNTAIALHCDSDPSARFVDVATPLFASKRRLPRKLYREDLLHLNRAGYEIWRDTLRPVLIHHESNSLPQR